jgi:hypothetical protein
MRNAVSSCDGVVHGNTREVKSRITNNGILARGYVRYFTSWEFNGKPRSLGTDKRGLLGPRKWREVDKGTS